MDLAAIENRLKNVKRASRKLANLSLELRNAVLSSLCDNLVTSESKILAANQEDCERIMSAAHNPAFLDRLRLNSKRLQQMRQSLMDVVDWPDPIGEIVEKKFLENGLEVQKQRSPLGVILMIFESRPNVITEAFSLAFKSGNGVILRGGSESRSTAAVLYGLIQTALHAHGVTDDSVWGISDPDRALVQTLMTQNQYIDVLVPRGGEGLIRHVIENATIPIIKNDRGLCHIYVHEDADFEMALNIVENAKAQRPGVCNSMETLIVNAKISEKFLPLAYGRLAPHGVQWHVCHRSFAILKSQPLVQAALDSSWDTEYLDLQINCRVVTTQDEAQEHIFRHGSSHSEAIVTSSTEAAKKFQSEVDAAAVYWNASTRFTDGFELGLGGELGISTQKLHVRGPVGLRELTSIRWVISGTGQIRTL